MTRQTRPMPLLLVGVVAACLVTGCLPTATARERQTTSFGTAAPAAVGTRRPTPVVRGFPPPTLAQLVGQKLIVALDAGTTASTALVGRIRRGEVGGVILFGRNVTTAAALAALTKQLRAAAATGGQPRLLIAVDQEGGAIKRIPWAPPTLSPPEMGKDGRAATAHAQGAETGVALAKLGINVDLAPVADVPVSTTSILYKQGRTFSFDADAVAALSTAFGDGLRSAGVVPAMKHFPGLGLATMNTDTAVVSINASKATLRPGLQPYRTAIADQMPLVMLSNATYPAYDAANAAGWSVEIGNDLLRKQLGFAGVTITDSLDGTAHARGVRSSSLAIRAAEAGTDLILLTGSEATSAAAYRALLAAATSDVIARPLLEASYARIEALKRGL